MEVPKYDGQELVDRGNSYVNLDGDIKPSADLEGIDNDDEAGELYDRQMQRVKHELGGQAVDLAAVVETAAGHRPAGDDGGIIASPRTGIKLNRDSIQDQITKIDVQISELQERYDNDPQIQRYERDWDKNDNAGIPNIEPDELKAINMQRRRLEWERSMLLRELEGRD